MLADQRAQIWKAWFAANLLVMGRLPDGEGWQQPRRMLQGLFPGGCLMVMLYAMED